MRKECKKKGAIGLGVLGMFFIIFGIVSSFYAKCTCGIGVVLGGILLLCMAVLNE